MTVPLKIGLSARIFYPEPDSRGIKTKTLQVLEQSIAHWIMRRDVMVLMIPTILEDGTLNRNSIHIGSYVDYLDGLVLQGGADISPLSYGEQPARAEWSGDRIRDRYELELVRGFISAGKPVLGICRGMQLLNVAFGGTLYQDLPSQRKGSIPHEANNYDHNGHSIGFTCDGNLSHIFGNLLHARVNSIHHQAIKDLGKNLIVEAVAEDGVIEAIRWVGNSFVYGVQWHPEFHEPSGQENFLDGCPLLDAFLASTRKVQLQPHASGVSWQSAP